MSFIRPGTEPKWVDHADTTGLYVYSDGDRISYLPSTEPEFVEVVMRMLEQSGKLEEDTLEDVYSAFAHRLHWDIDDTDLSRNTTRTDAYMDLTTAVAWLKDREGWEEEHEIAKEIWIELDPDTSSEREP